MDRFEHGGAGRTFLVSLLVIAVLGLGGVVVYLLSQVNHQRYRLGTEESTLVVERGRLLPFGFERFEPEAPDLQAGYAPISIPPGERFQSLEIFTDRADLDRALFALLANWARDRLSSPKPGDFELGASFVRRCELLPGLSEEQRIELKTLRADLAFRNGRRMLGNIVEQLRKAGQEFENAKRLGTGKDVDKWIADVERRIRDYEELPQPGPAQNADPMLNAPSLPEQPLSGQSPDSETHTPKWRL